MLEELLPNKIRLVSTESSMDTDFVKVLKAFKNDKNQLIIHLTKPIKLDVWEDYLMGNLPDVVYNPKRKVKEEPPYVITARKKEVILPKTYYVEKYKEIPSKDNLLWEVWTRNKMGFRFPPNWSFPRWISESLKTEVNSKLKFKSAKIDDVMEAFETWKINTSVRDLSFDNFSRLGLDYLLAEYAGVIDRGTNFELKEDSPIRENLKCYLRMVYGGESGLEKQIELWLEALDIRNQGLPSTLGRRNASFHNPEKEIRDGVFMGSVDIKGVANESITKGVFTLNNRTYRKYHEGSNRSKLKKVRIDTDPSDMNTCSDVARREDKMRRKGRQVNPKFSGEVSLPEGLSFFEEEEFTPTLEHIPTIMKQLKNRYIPIYGPQWGEEDIGIVEYGSGYYKLVIENNVIKRHFVPTFKWGKHYDSSTKKMNEGHYDWLKKNNPTDIPNWKLCNSEVILMWKTWDEDGNVIHNTIRCKGDKRRDPIVKDIIEKRKRINPNIEITDPQLLSCSYIFSNETQSWYKPKPFTIINGEVVKKEALPFPDTFHMTTWNNIRRWLSTFATIEKLLAEERWERLAFDERKLIDHSERLQLERSIYEEDFEEEDISPEEAVARINHKVEEIIEEINNHNDIHFDTKSKLIETAKNIKNSIHTYVYGERTSEEITLNNCNQVPCSEPAKRKLSCENPLERVVMTNDIRLISLLNKKIKDTREDHMKSLYKKLQLKAYNRLYKKENTKEKYNSSSIVEVKTEEDNKKVNSKVKLAVLAYEAFELNDLTSLERLKRISTKLSRDTDRAYGRHSVYNRVRLKKKRRSI